MANRPPGIGKGIRNPNKGRPRSSKTEERERRSREFRLRPPPATRRPLSDEVRDRIVADGLLDQCDLTAKAYVRRTRRPDLYGEYYQQSFLGLAEAMKKVDPSYRNTLSTYAYKAMRGACKEFCRRNETIRISRGVRYGSPDLPRVVPYDEAAGGEGSSVFSVPDFRGVAEDGVVAEDSYEAWMVGLGAEERFIVRAYVIDERTFRDIGEEIGRTESCVSQKYRRTMARLRERATEPRYRELLTA